MRTYLLIGTVLLVLGACKEIDRQSYMVVRVDDAMSGKDGNSDGVRDDLEPWIKSVSRTRNESYALGQLARSHADRLLMNSDEDVIIATSEVMAAYGCLLAISGVQRGQALHGEFYVRFYDNELREKRYASIKKKLARNPASVSINEDGNTLELCEFHVESF